MADGGLNDRHAVLNRSQAEAYFGRWDALLDGRVMQIEPQLRLDLGGGHLPHRAGGGLAI